MHLCISADLHEDGVMYEGCLRMVLASCDRLGIIWKEEAV